MKSMQELFYKVQTENLSPYDFRVYFQDWSDGDLILMLEQLEYLARESQERVRNIIQYEIGRRFGASLFS
jgi:hypothetical protein